MTEVQAVDKIRTVPAPSRDSMRLAYAFLANAADITPEGKLYVLGGDIDTINAGAFPFLMPSIALVVKLTRSADERVEEVRLHFSVLTSEGREIAGAQSAVPPEAQAKEHIGLVINFALIPFERPGKYAVRGSANGQEVFSLPLHVVAS